MCHPCREVCVEGGWDFLFAVDSLAMLDNAHTLSRLIEVNRLDNQLPTNFTSTVGY